MLQFALLESRQGTELSTLCSTNTVIESQLGTIIPCMNYQNLELTREADHDQCGDQVNKSRMNYFETSCSRKACRTFAIKAGLSFVWATISSQE